MLRSTLAVVLGFIAVTLLGYAGQQLFAVILPEQAMPGTSLVTVAGLMVLAFEALCNVAGGVVTGMVAPRRPVKHAAVLGAIETLLVLWLSASLLEHSPGWLAVALIVVTLPATVYGGRLAERFRPVADVMPEGPPALIRREF
ncbi:MAG: hypothetical protein V4555_00305 [Acidobacteriota bacterium]